MCKQWQLLSCGRTLQNYPTDDLAFLLQTCEVAMSVVFPSLATTPCWLLPPALMPSPSSRVPLRLVSTWYLKLLTIDNKFWTLNWKTLTFNWGNIKLSTPIRKVFLWKSSFLLEWSSLSLGLATTTAEVDGIVVDRVVKARRSTVEWKGVVFGACIGALQGREVVVTLEKTTAVGAAAINSEGDGGGGRCGSSHSRGQMKM